MKEILFRLVSKLEVNAIIRNMVELIGLNIEFENNISWLPELKQIIYSIDLRNENI